MVKANENQPTRYIIRAREVCKKSGLSLSWIHEQMHKGLFPKNFKIIPGGRASGWYSDEIDAWLENRRTNGGSNA